MLTLDDIEAFKPSQQQVDDEERVKRVKERAARGAREHRLFHSGDDWAALRYIKRLEAQLEMHIRVETDLLDQMRSAGLDAMGLHGYRGDADT